MPLDAISTTTRRWTYTGDGVTAAFAYNNYIVADSDLEVYLELIASPYTQTLQTLTTHYTVSGAGSIAGGNVTFVTPPASTHKVVIVSKVPNTQPSTFNPRRDLAPDALTAAYHRLAAQVQQLQAKLDRTLRPADGDTEAPAATAAWRTFFDKFLYVNASGDIEPAATTDTLVAAAWTALLAATPARGDLIRGNASLLFEKLALGAADTFLGSDGSDASYRTPAQMRTSLAIEGADFSNRLINGEFRFWQRGTSLASQADDTYGAMGDRWYILTQSGTIAGARQNNPFNGARHSGRLTQSQASAQRIGAAQIVEGINCIDLRGQAVTFYGRLKISSGGNIRVAIVEWTGTEDAVTSDFVNDWTSSTYTAGNFFTSTSTTITAVKQYASPGTGWVDFFVTGTLGSSLTNLAVMLWTEGTAAQNVTLELANCGLVRGSVAPFAHAARSYSREYLLCSRYYFKTFDIDTTPAQNAGEQEFAWASPQIGGAASGGRASDLVFPVRMFATPTVTAYNPAAANAFWRNTEVPVDATTTNMGGVSKRRLRSQWTTGAGSSASQISHVHVTCEAEL